MELEVHGATVRLDGGPAAETERAVVEAGQDVQVDGHAECLGGLPERLVVLRRERQVGVWHLPHETADHPSLLAPLELPHALLGVVGGDAGDAEAAVRRDRAVPHQPVVVELEACLLGPGVLHAEEPEALGGIEHLGAHAVLRHLVDALGWVVASRTVLVERPR